MNTSVDAVGGGGGLLPGIARRSVEAVLLRLDEEPPRFEEGMLSQPAALFVTIRNRAGGLRGCIGNLEPKYPTVVDETWWVARLSAFQDNRFEPVRREELEALCFEVSVLGKRETIGSEAGLDPSRYGLMVSTEDGRCGVLLPGLEDVTTVEEQVRIAHRKGGILPGEPVTFERFEVEKFKEQ